MCTVKEVALGVKSIISYADCPKAERAPSTFWEVLRKWQCTWMWENLQWVGDDDWIAEAIAEESLIAVPFLRSVKLLAVIEVNWSA
jgi:hypothetical protein